MAGDPFTSAIFRWLDQVAADPAVPPVAFKLAYVISQHINRRSHIAWPSQETLACAMNVPHGENATRQIRRLLKPLIEAGYLLTTRRKQSSLVYRLAQDRTPLSYQDEQSEVEDRLRPDDNVRSNNQDRTSEDARPDNFGRQDRTPVSAKPLKEPPNEPERERARAEFLPDGFDLKGDDRAWAVDRLGSEASVARSLDRFRDHYRQVDGPKAKSRDWTAKARLWIDDDAGRDNKETLSATANRLAASGLQFGPRPRPHGSQEVAPATITGPITEDAWDAALSAYTKFGRWTKHSAAFGPSPADPGCIVPKHLLAKHGISKGEAA